MAVCCGSYFAGSYNLHSSKTGWDLLYTAFFDCSFLMLTADAIVGAKEGYLQDGFTVEN